MGLTFKKIEPVQFGDLVATPKLTNEIKLRISAALGKADTADGMAELTKQLAAAFPDHKEEVAAFIESNMTMDDIAQLATYIISGDKGLSRLNAALEGGADGE